MVTKEIVKQEIDHLPDDVIEQVYVFMQTIQLKKPMKQLRKQRIRTFKLQGQFDSLHIRELAYE